MPIRFSAALALTALALALAAAAPARADDAFGDGHKAFQRARELMLKEYVDEKIDDDKLWRGATAGLLGIDGKWDKLLSPTELAELQSDLRGEMVGLGIQISVDDAAGVVHIDSVIAGSAAAKAGLQPNDNILKIDGKPVRGTDHTTVARSIRGRAGTSVTLTILRDAQVLTRTIKRAPFVFEPVTQQMLPNGVALVHVRAFNDKTPMLLKAALERARAAGLKALVLDLRNNEGGLFDRMLECAGELLPKNTLVVTSVRRGGKTAEERTSGEPLMTGVPMAALINNGTASGAEMLAAALQASGARIVGKRTRGKWNAQQIEPLGNGWAAKITIAWFRAPSGQMLDGKGLEPDVEVEMDPKAMPRALLAHEPAERLAADPQLRAAVSLLRLAR
jgi:carboxyl-terminal processing protease